MFIRVKLHGSGEEGDPIRANLPTYSRIFHSFTHDHMYVYVPDDTHPFDDENPPDGTWEETGVGSVLVSLSDEHHQKWHAHLDEKYREHRGKFRPIVK